MANLRGGLHGVVDLAAFLGLRAPQPPRARREQARLLALQRGAAACNCARAGRPRWPACAAPTQLRAAEPTTAAARPALAGARWRDADGTPLAGTRPRRAWPADEQFLAIGV
ncbi:MAG: hypothetical protein MZW92_77715 [Comamonadaceae bacterium]|nr:hypothetical protein [Comamonadaceae bacterium]